MIAYILDSVDLQIKDILQFNTYTIRMDIDFAEKSSIVLSKTPNILNDDFAILKADDNKIIMIGVCDTCDSSSNNTCVTVNIRQQETLFDRRIFCGDEKIIANIGIEDFIVAEINNNFISSGDPAINKDFLIIKAETHTKLAKKIETEEGGIYNLKTFLGNCKQYYNIFMDYSMDGNKLEVKVYRKEHRPLNIDVGVTDIANYTETYEITVLSKLYVKWKRPDTEDEEGNLILGPIEERQFFLLTNRTISEVKSHPDRAAGSIECQYIEMESEEEMLQSVYDTFSGNAYNHKITFDLVPSQIYPVQELYVGKECVVKTQSGIRKSMITGLSRSSDSNLYQIKLGNLNITLIEKLRRRKN